MFPYAPCRHVARPGFAGRGNGTKQELLAEISDQNRSSVLGPDQTIRGWVGSRVHRAQRGNYLVADRAEPDEATVSIYIYNITHSVMEEERELAGSSSSHDGTRHCMWRRKGRGWTCPLWNLDLSTRRSHYILNSRCRSREELPWRPSASPSSLP